MNFQELIDFLSEEEDSRKVSILGNLTTGLLTSTFITTSVVVIGDPSLATIISSGISGIGTAVTISESKSLGSIFRWIRGKSAESPTLQKIRNRNEQLEIGHLLLIHLVASEVLQNDLMPIIKKLFSEMVWNWRSETSIRDFIGRIPFAHSIIGLNPHSPSLVERIKNTNRQEVLTTYFESLIEEFLEAVKPLFTESYWNNVSSAVNKPRLVEEVKSVYLAYRRKLTLREQKSCKEFVKFLDQKWSQDVVNDLVQIKKSITSSSSQYYNLIPSNNLRLEDLMPTRVRNQQVYHFYYRRPFIDNKLTSNLQSSRNSLIIGRPLSGKTRAAFHSFSQLQNSTILIPRNIDFQADFRLPKKEHNGNLVAFLDDIHNLVKNQNGEILIKELIKSRVPIIAACQTGPEYRLLKWTLEDKDEKLLETFDIIEIPRFTEDELLELPEEIKAKSDQEAFDGTIGSLFLELTKMKGRYQRLAQGKIPGWYHTSGDEKPMAQLCVDLLWALKALYITGNMKSNSVFSTEKASEYVANLVEKRFSKNLGRKLQRRAQQRLDEALDFTYDNFDNCLEILRQDKFNLNFIHREFGSFLLAEEVYLDKVVAVEVEIYDQTQIRQDIIYFYPDEKERLSQGYLLDASMIRNRLKDTVSFEEGKSILSDFLRKPTFVDTFSGNHLISLTEDYFEAESLFRKIQEYGFVANHYTLVLLIKKSPSYEIARKIFIQEGIKRGNIGVQAYNTLIGKAPSYQTATRLFEEMKDYGVVPKETTLISISSKASNFSEAIQYLNLFEELEIKPSIEMYKALVRKAPNYTIALNLLKSMDQFQVKPTAEFFRNIAGKAPDFQTAFRLLETVDMYKTKPSAEIFRNIAGKALDYPMALSLLKTMDKYKVKPSPGVFESIAGKAPNYSTAQGMLKTMDKYNIKPTADVFKTIVGKAPNFQNALSALEIMDRYSVKPSAEVFKNIVAKAPDFQTALGLLGTMDRYQVKPTAEVFKSIAAKAPDFQTALGLLEKIDKYKVMPTVDVFTSIAAKAPDFLMALSLLETMDKYVFCPSAEVFKSIAAKAPDFETALSFLETVAKYQVEPTLDLFKTIAGKAPDYQTALSLLETINDYQVTYSAELFYTLAAKTPDFPTALSLLETMEKYGVKPSSEIFYHIIYKAPNYQVAVGLLETMKKYQIKPKKAIFYPIIEKAPDYTTALELLNTMEIYKVKPSLASFRRIIDKAPTYKIGKDLLETMDGYKVKPSVGIFISLAVKAPDFITATSLLEIMKRYELKPSTEILAIMIEKSPNYQDLDKVSEDTELVKVSYHIFSKHLGQENPNTQILKQLLESHIE
ncbi:MAG: hypothetical protein AAF824_03050 [Bacteroidota bacterium]